MKKLLFLMCLVAGFAHAQMGYVREVTLDTNGVGSVTWKDVRGELAAIHVYSVTTGNVTVAYATIGGLPSVNIATNTVTNTKVFRPVAQSTDVSGTGITDYSSYQLAGEDVTFSVAGGASGSTWKCLLVLK